MDISKITTLKEIKEAEKYLLKKELEIKAINFFKDDEIVLSIMKKAIKHCSVIKKKSLDCGNVRSFRSSFTEENMHYDVFICLEFCEEPQVTITTYSDCEIRQTKLEEKIKSFFL